MWVFIVTRTPLAARGLVTVSHAVVLTDWRGAAKHWGTCVEGQVRPGLQQPDPVKGVLAHGRGVGSMWSSRSLPIQAILWSCELWTPAQYSLCLAPDVLSRSSGYPLYPPNCTPHPALEPLRQPHGPQSVKCPREHLGLSSGIVSSPRKSLYPVTHPQSYPLIIHLSWKAFCSIGT